MYFYTIYTDGLWSVLTINNPILDIIFLASSLRFYAYYIMLCDILCDHSQIFFIFQKEKKKRKKKRNQIKENR